MFTKPVGEDDASPVVSAVGARAERIEHARGTLEDSFGLKVSGKGVIIAAIVAFNLLRGLFVFGQAGDWSISLIAMALLLGYPAIFLMGKIQRHREAVGATLGTDGPVANVCLRVLYPVMWLAGRWWGTFLLLVFWPVIFTGLYFLTHALMPILIGALTFWLLWTFGNRLLRNA